MRRALLALLALTLARCRPDPEDRAAAPAGPALALLFMGNSHSALHELPEIVAALVRAARPGQEVAVTQAPGWLFLDERARDPASLQLLREGRWSFVVLQAQRYSTSGTRTYSSAEAEALVQEARALGAVPVLFPEWPRRGVDETRRIFAVHQAIAAAAPACVAPVGQAWDRARAAYPDLVLHAGDGNHAAPAGAFLAALVLAAVMTGVSPERLPFLPQFGISAEVQVRLRAAAAEALAAEPPGCPE